MGLWRDMLSLSLIYFRYEFSFFSTQIHLDPQNIKHIAAIENRSHSHRTQIYPKETLKREKDHNKRSFFYEVISLQEIKLNSKRHYNTSKRRRTARDLFHVLLVRFEQVPLDLTSQRLLLASLTRCLTRLWLEPFRFDK